ncbi:MAG TPA: hypothetical protein PK668_26930 [Myxococcota bacterium]|nr:hypothetical protein [Myxococcota bacterium]HRY97163.1 hypothetical protein [Myxococcota bacterium]HSA20704.1 hypothetical protein [Myxococcota bacterium]
MRTRASVPLALELACLLGLSLALVAPACDGASDRPCSELNPCLGELACDPTGHCVPAATLEIVNARLADGALGLGYHDALRARGGLLPYTYRLVEGPPWLSLDPASGELGGTPDQPCSELVTRVSVTDGSYGRGRTTEVGLLLSVAACVGGQLQACHYAEDNRCLLGAQTCPAGQWGECEDGAPSVDPGRCGPACAPCDPARSDRCAGGLCACGDRPACAAGDSCCGAECTRLEDDPRHCGACDVRCADRLRNVTRPACLDGACGYEACLPGFLDCDGDRVNGCETAEGLENCGACEADCLVGLQAAEGARCAYLPEGGRACDYEACAPEALDCDATRANGCETPRSPAACAACGDDCRAAGSGGPLCLHAQQGAAEEFRCGCAQADDCGALGGLQRCCAGRCAALDEPENCGGCGQVCSRASGGERCLDPLTGRCGCLGDADCGPLDLCCDEVCVPRSADQCLACGQACTPAEGGPRCDRLRGACACDEDGECNDLPGSRQSCGAIGAPQACTCGLLGHACAGGPESQCCPTLGGGLGCVDLTSDPQNCGGCGLACGPDMGCVAGACQCSQLSGPGCPADGPAPHCRGFQCACPDFAGGVQACAPGQSCCAGDAGGQGGPGDGPDLGCCHAPCGQNLPGDCRELP